MIINRLNKTLSLTKCYTPLIKHLIKHLTDEELKTCIINDTNIIDDNKVIVFFKMIQDISFNDHISEKCTCKVSIKDVYFIQKINDHTITLPIGSVCIQRFQKFKDEFKKLDKTVWNPDKYCKHCGEGGLRGWRKGKVYKQCYYAYMHSKK